MKLTKKDIEAANLAPELANEILSLFDAVEAKESELSKLRAKVPTDSQKVVESVDHEKFLAAQTELEALKKSIAEKLGDSGTEEASDLLSLFGGIFK